MGAGREASRSPPSSPRPRSGSLSRCPWPRVTRAAPEAAPTVGPTVLTAHRRAAKLGFPRVGCLAPRAGIARGYSCAEGPQPCARCAHGASRSWRCPSRARLRGCGGRNRAHAAVRLPAPTRVGPPEGTGGPVAARRQGMAQAGHSAGRTRCRQGAEHLGTSRHRCPGRRRTKARCLSSRR